MCGAVALAFAGVLAIPILLVYVCMCLRYGVSPLLAGLGGYLIWALLYCSIGFPCFAAEVRRLHDAGKSGCYELWWLVPIFGWIKMFRILVSKGDPDVNAYGPPPQE